jgi:SAM-dependent methyltransferase
MVFDRELPVAFWDDLWKAKQVPIVINTWDIHFIEALATTIESVVPRVDNGRLLEIGCGTGCWLAHFSQKRGYEVYGIDSSPESIQLAKKNLAFQKIKGHLIQGDLRDPALVEKYQGYFDVVLSLGFIEHFPRPGEILSDHISLLKPGGHLIVEIPNLNLANRMMTRLLNIQSPQRVRDYLGIHNLRLCSLRGLKEVVLKRPDLKPLYLDSCGAIGLEIYVLAVDPHRLLSLNRKMKRVIDLFHWQKTRWCFSPSVLLVARYQP